MISRDEQATVENKLVELLGEKNHYLTKFIQLNEDELLNFEDGYFDNVEPFYQSREKVLDIIRCIDALIDEEVRALGDVALESIDPEVRVQIEKIMQTKDSLAKRILSQDLQVLAAIEHEKSNIIRELQQTADGRKLVRAYGSSRSLASTNGAAAGAMAAPTRQIDEEA